MAPKRTVTIPELGRLPQFSHAGLSDDLVFVSGTLGTLDGLKVIDGGVGPETTQCLANMARILEASGSSVSRIIKLNVYLADMDDFAAMNAAYSSVFTGEVPARITVGGVSLALDARVEMECVATRARDVPSVGASAIPRRTGFVEHDGELLYFEVCGEGGVPLVLSHGAGGSHASWFQQVASFARDRMVVTWDHRGYGKSSDRADLSGPEVAAGDLLAITDALGITRADFVGQSMGGWTVVGAALRAPDLVRRMVLCDTLGGFTSEAIERGLSRRTAGSLAGPETLGSHPALSSSFSARSPELAHLYQSLGTMGTADPAVIIGRLLSLTHDTDEATRLTMPILCIVGDQDPLFPPASIRALADLLVDARVVEITGSGHSPYFEDPAAWNATVEHFLAAGDAET